METTKTYQLEEDVVCVIADEDDDSPVRYETYTAGTVDPLYSGPDKTAARESLSMDEQTFHNLLMSDAAEDFE